MCKNFKESQKREEHMWNAYGSIIKDILTKNNPLAKIERINGILDYLCGIDAVVVNPLRNINSIRFISLRILNNNYDTFTFRKTHSNKQDELEKLLSLYNPSPSYHIQITEGKLGTQIAILDVLKLSMYVEKNIEFWEIISNYIKKAERNDYYSIPIAKFKRFIKVIDLK